MYTVQDLFDILTDEEIYYTLKPLIEEDCYINEFVDGDLLEYFLNFILACGIVWIASDDRVLLTEKGEKVLNFVAKTVELDSKSTKLKKKKYGNK